MKQLYNKKGAVLVAAILLLFTGAVFMLVHVALNGCGSPLSGAGAPTAGAELGGFTITAYCPGACCNGEWAGLTASGRSIGYYQALNIRIAAVDPAFIPLGSRFTYGGTEYRAVDTGGKILGKRIDLLMPDHHTANEFGVKRGQSIRILEGGTPDTGDSWIGGISSAYDRHDAVSLQ